MESFFLVLFLPHTGRGSLQGVSSRTRICESATGYTFTPCVGLFTSPDIDNRWSRVYKLPHTLRTNQPGDSGSPCVGGRHRP